MIAESPHRTHQKTKCCDLLLVGQDLDIGQSGGVIDGEAVFAMEGTSSFGAGLCRELLAAGFAVVEANRLDRSIRRRRGKDDSIDAEVAAKVFLGKRRDGNPQSGAEHVEMIRMLKIAKDSAIDCRTKAINQIRGMLVTAPPALRERLSGLGRGELISTVQPSGLLSCQAR